MGSFSKLRLLSVLSACSMIALGQAQDNTSTATITTDQDNPVVDVSPGVELDPAPVLETPSASSEEKEEEEEEEEKLPECKNGIALHKYGCKADSDCAPANGHTTECVAGSCQCPEGDDCDSHASEKAAHFQQCNASVECDGYGMGTGSPKENVCAQQLFCIKKKDDHESAPSLCHTCDSCKSQNVKGQYDCEKICTDEEEEKESEEDAEGDADEDEAAEQEDEDVENKSTGASLSCLVALCFAAVFHMLPITS